MGATVTETKQSEELLQLVSFNLSGEEYGVDILMVQEINRMINITKVPKCPDFVEGVINLRGRVIPIISLRKRFGLATKEMDKSTRIIVVNIAGKRLPCRWRFVGATKSYDLAEKHLELPLNYARNRRRPPAGSGMIMLRNGKPEKHRK